MKDIPSIINFKDITKEMMPHYFDFAAAIYRIKELLVNETGIDFNMYTSKEGIAEEIWDTIEYVVQSDPNDIQIIGHVFDCLETATIKYSNFNQEHQFNIIPSLNNSVYYFPMYQVAFAKLPIFQSHEDYEEDFIFANNDESLLGFFDYIYMKQKEYMKDAITIFTDTDDGIERVKERITHQVMREDVLLDEEIKTEIFRSIDEFFIHGGEFFKKYDIPYKRGILLYGSPGNGKTTLVKSIAGSISAPVVYWQITEYTNSYSIKEVFNTVTKMAPMTLVIEDIDSMPEESRSVFLNALDGASSKEGIFLIGTTNYPEKIDPALINRAGRFDRAYEITLPDQPARRQYLIKKNIHQFVSENEIDHLVKETNGLSIAQLNELYMSIALQWHYEQQVNIEKILRDLQTNNRKALRNHWEERSSVGFGI
ncbi:AAA family ATPase [Heyndrickxia oleronia]|uniref:AAA family ATPase n=1 Tax=Heyndrickxia oleronia TaxID=38875 RepID=UPI003F8466F3